ncbi:MAG: glycosyltransferase family 4 protein [Flavobacteriales bacterium]
MGQDKVCHITTVHPARDLRIFHKECKALKEAGYEVTLIANDPEVGEGDIDGITVRQVGVPVKSRVQRILKVARAAFRKALEVDAELYHFHDPEFLPFAKKLIRSGKKVIYDAHEDLPRQLLSKHWVPSLLRKGLSRLVERYEDRTSEKLTAVVAATDHIRERFAKSNEQSWSIKNYPILSESSVTSSDPGKMGKKVCYIGSITRVRGVAELVRALPMTEAELDLAGDFPEEKFREELKELEGWEQVNELGFLDREGIQNVLAEARAGLVTLHPIINYVHALPVKLFEYMEAGLPVIASDFPALVEIIDEQECGITVDPKDPRQIAEAIQHLLQNPEEAARMGSNGKRAVQEKFNWGREAERLRRVYTKLLEKSKEA